MHIAHPLLKEGVLEAREYQQAIFSKAAEKNLLVVLPTGLGKTPIAVLLTVNRLEKFPESKIMVLAPTKPLSDQHCKSFSGFLSLPEDAFSTITGSISPEKRGDIYRGKRLFFATPQTIENDIKSGIFSFRDFSLLVIDEMHRSVGNYSYPFLAEKYMEQAANPRILGLTASPSSDYGTIREICERAHIEQVEIKAEEDADVASYVKQKVVEWVEVELPSSFLEIRRRLAETYEERVESLRKLGLRIPKNSGKKVLLSFQKSLARELSRSRRAIIAMSILNQAIKADHALTLLETQGIVSLENYFKKLRDDPKAARFLKNRLMQQAQFLTNSLFLSGAKHPKMAKLFSIVSTELSKNPGSKIIIFANYRDMVSQIVESAGKIDGAKPVAFTGQRAGLSQKQQISILDDFRAGKHNILVGTSVSEEGLDIPSMDTAIFYEPVPSEIRSIQRRGRVGRHSAGRVVVLIAKKTRDEAFYWSARHKERKMKSILRDMQGGNLDGSMGAGNQPGHGS